MGYEYRLLIAPGVPDMEAVCASVFASSRWDRIQTSFSDGVGVGVRDSTMPADSSWPQVADLRPEGASCIFVVCHNQSGGLFLHALVGSLEDAGYTVTIDDDV